MPCKEALFCTSCFRYGPTKATKPADKIKEPFGADIYLLVGVAVDVPCITTNIWEGGKDKRSSTVETQALYHELCETCFVIRLDLFVSQISAPSLSQPQPQSPRTSFVATNAGCTTSRYHRIFISNIFQSFRGSCAACMTGKM
jgi:hypothetical protein